MFQIKRKNLFYFFLFFFLLIKLSFQQSILFPFLNFKFDDDEEEEESKEKAYDDGLKPVYEKNQVSEPCVFRVQGSTRSVSLPR